MYKCISFQCRKKLLDGWYPRGLISRGSIPMIVKTYISNLVRTTRFWNNLHQVRSQSRKTGKPGNLNVFGERNPKVLNRIHKLDWGHIYLRQENPSVKIYYIMLELSISKICIYIPSRCRYSDDWVDDTLGDWQSINRGIDTFNNNKKP